MVKNIFLLAGFIVILVIIFVAINGIQHHNVSDLVYSTPIELLDDLAPKASYYSIDGVQTEFNSENKILLFRGIHAFHPQIEKAKLGIVEPWGGHDNPLKHNMGDNRSVYTSWTSNIFVALQFAKGKNKKQIGVILAKTFDKKVVIPSPDKFQQGEFLIKGNVYGCLVVDCTNIPC